MDKFKIYHPIVGLGLWDEVCIPAGQFEEDCHNDGKIHIHLSEVFDFWKNNGVKILPSTGLFDKSSIEIYERDIVKEHDGRISVVILHQGAFYFTNPHTKKTRLAGQSKFIGKCEILGNYYINKELLKTT